MWSASVLPTTATLTSGVIRSYSPINLSLIDPARRPADQPRIGGFLCPKTRPHNQRGGKTRSVAPESHKARYEKIGKIGVFTASRITAVL